MPRTTVLAALLFAFAASALAETHPVTLFTASGYAAAKARLSREPYASWMTRLITKADAIVADNIDWPGSVVTREIQSYDARLLAAAYAFSDSGAANRTAYGREASKALRALPRTGYKKDKEIGEFSTDLSVSESALRYAEAYDLLRGAGFDFAASDTTGAETVIRGNLAALRKYMAGNTFGSPAGTIGGDFTSATFIFVEYSDNHHVKLFAALSVLALVILDETDSQRDLDTARGRLVDTVGNLTITGDDGSPAGGWAEGPSYHEYAAHEYVPAFEALAHAGLFSYANYPEIVETHLQLARIAMPDGFMPPLDDNGAVIHDFTGLLGSIHKDRADRGALLKVWSDLGGWVSDDYLPDYLAAYDDTPVVTDPAALGLPPTEFRSESGYARFRSSWNKGADWFYIAAEHGEARIKGQAHEHPDPGAFMLHSRGELLLLDSGYGGFAYHDSTRFARNHNLILVDGQGPSGASKSFFGNWQANGADAYLGGGFISTGLEYTSVRTTYQKTDFTRYTVYSGKKYFIVCDTALSKDPHTFTLLLHGNGGGMSGGTFALTETGGVWERPNASIRAHVTGTNDRVSCAAPLSVATEDMKHAVYQNEPFLTHTVLRAAQDGTSARFLTVLTPYGKSETAPAVTAITAVPPESGTGFRVALEDTAEYWAVRGSAAAVGIAASGDTVSTDGDLLMVRYPPGDSRGRVFCAGGTSIRAGADTLVSASASAVLSLEFPSADLRAGDIVAPAGTTVILHGFTASRVTFGGSEIARTARNGRTTFVIPGSGTFRAEKGIEPPSAVRVADIPNDNGHKILISWTLSPSERDGDVAVYRIFRSRTPIFANPVPISRFSSLDSLSAWEAHAAVLVDSVAAGMASYTDQSVPLNGAAYYYWLQAAGPGGASKPVPADRPTSVSERPRTFALGPARPNPFNPSVVIPFTIGSDAAVTLTVHTITGARAATVVEGRMRAGSHEARWNAAGFPSGVYLFVLRVNGKRAGTVKAVCVK